MKRPTLTARSHNLHRLGGYCTESGAEWAEHIVYTRMGFVRVSTYKPSAVNPRGSIHYSYTMGGRYFSWSEECERTHRGLYLKAHSIIRQLMAGKYDKAGAR